MVFWAPILGTSSRTGNCAGLTWVLMWNDKPALAGLSRRNVHFSGEAVLTVFLVCADMHINLAFWVLASFKF